MHHLPSRYSNNSSRRHPLLVVLNLRNSIDCLFVSKVTIDRGGTANRRGVVVNGNGMLFGLSLMLLPCTIKIQPSIPFKKMCVNTLLSFSFPSPPPSLQKKKTLGARDASWYFFFRSFFSVTGYDHHHHHGFLSKG